MVFSMEDAFSKVYKVFGIEKLNKHQEDSIKYVVENEKDNFVNLRTGFSKLLIYQALPIVFLSVQSTCEKYVVVVISPLTSSMKNQVSGLTKFKNVLSGLQDSFGSQINWY